jgi:cytochrome d ubiquinol oxidase subunit II
VRVAAAAGRQLGEGNGVTTIAAGLVCLVALVLYAVLGGADFGGGVWDLLATGRRTRQQRIAISDAIGPVWEANHVWLIYVVVLLFTCFPLAFADIATALYVPLTLALVGIVLRGAAFVFRNYAAEAAPVAATWTAVFGIASLATPFFLGDAVGALATGRYAWTSPFALLVGFFAIGVCAQVAAVFILLDVPAGDVREDFRRRAVRATIAVWVLGALPAIAIIAGEPTLHAAMLHPAAICGVVVALLSGLAVIALVAARSFALARFAVGVEAAAIFAGWFGAQAPDIVPGKLTYVAAASSDAMIGAFLVATGLGAIVLIPSLALLVRVFKGGARA